MEVDSASRGTRVWDSRMSPFAGVCPERLLVVVVGSVGGQVPSLPLGMMPAQPALVFAEMSVAPDSHREH